MKKWPYRMNKILLAIILFITLSFNVFAQTMPSNREMADKMSTIDGRQHSIDQFESALNVIHKYFPEGIEGRPASETYFNICFYLTKMYDKAKEVTPDLGLYEFVYGFKDFVRDSGGSGTFTQVLAIYTAGKMSGD